ncbi:glutamate--tRNA ligase, partial [Candidatus Woesearchaeota archaeon]|nr:glutamate--tRNA ligase [Candidatus Woesearchaeota archaeon]
MVDVEAIIREAVLENAVKFNGKANPKAIIGAVIKAYPNAKKDMKTIVQDINKITEEINALEPEAQKKELLKIHPDYFKEQDEEKQQRKEERQELPELKNAEMGKVITRMPPEPSKYNHLGHAMSFLINYLYAKKYEGKCIL